MDLALLKEGAIIMAIGMGTVFVFLTIMIYAMNINELVLKFLGKFFPEELPEEKKSVRRQDSSKDDEIALAIVCAINKASKA